ncbi:MAG: Maf family protein [Patescibacteria group bacterium]|nr:Maf family protein [Patescibacteria group bacterium]
MRKAIILASSSERKKRLFSLLGIPFATTEHKFDEKNITTIDPKKYVVEIARGKVESIRNIHPNSIIIGLDTVVVHKGSILGKPKNKTEALSMLLFLNGSVHQVITGLYIYDTANNKRECLSMITDMHFKKNDKHALTSYIDKENVLDVAGAYNHERLGCILLKKINGDYYNSIGMPLSLIADALKKFNITIL